MGACAYKTCELDAALGGFATQYRETQDHESNKFLGIFKNNGGVMYLEGGWKLVLGTLKERSTRHGFCTSRAGVMSALKKLSASVSP